MTLAVYLRSETTTDALKHPYIFSCDTLLCDHTTAHKSQEDAEQMQDTHKCPRLTKRSWILTETDEKGQPYTKITYGKSLAESLWDDLDRTVEDIRKGSDSEHNKGLALGLAIAVQKMCKPYYADTNAVLKQAMRRYRMKIGEIDWEPTMGYSYNPPPPGSVIREREEAKQPRPPAKPDISDEDKATMKSALESGIIQIAELAKMYNLTEGQVQEIVGS